MISGLCRVLASLFAQLIISVTLIAILSDHLPYRYSLDLKIWMFWVYVGCFLFFNVVGFLIYRRSIKSQVRPSILLLPFMLPLGIQMICDPSGHERQQSKGVGFEVVQSNRKQS